MEVDSWWLNVNLWTLVVSAFAAWLCYYYIAKDLWCQWCGRRPPGPWNLPLVGYLPRLDPKTPHLSLMELSKRYGPIFALRLGRIYTVVLSDVNLIRKAFQTDGANVRAPLYLTHGLMNGYGLICADGTRWRDQRKFIANTLRTMGATKSSSLMNRLGMQELILSHASELIEEIRDVGKEICIDPSPLLSHHLGNLISSIVFGRRFDRHDATWIKLQHLQDEGTKLVGVAGPLNYLPFLRFLPTFRRSISFLLNGIRSTHIVYGKLIEKERNLPSSITTSNENLNIIRAFLREKELKADTPNAFLYDHTQLLHLMADIFGAGLDTTLTTLRWFLLYIAINEAVQDRIRAELRSINPYRWAVGTLPYLEACIAEVQRIRSVLPVGFPHGTDRPIKIADYDIPAETMLLPLQWAIHMNPEHWIAPETFNPDRFLDDEGAFKPPENFLPFQMGRRMCVGDELARMILLLFSVKILSNFQVDIISSQKIDLDGECGITLTPKPYRIHFTPLYGIHKLD